MEPILLANLASSQCWQLPNPQTMGVKFCNYASSLKALHKYSGSAHQLIGNSLAFSESPMTMSQPGIEHQSFSVFCS